MRAVPALVQVAFVFAAACGGDDAPAQPDASVPDAAVDQVASIAFAAKVNGAAFKCGQTYADVGTPAAPYTISDFRLYVHDVALTGPAGTTKIALDANAWQRDGVALLDFEDGCDQGTPELHATITGRVAPGSYTGVQFKLGLPATLNHLDVSTAKPPLSDSSMYWAWRSGYKFLKVDGKSGDASFFIHLGSTECPGPSPSEAPSAACTRPNVPTIALATTITDPSKITVTADLGTLLAPSNVAANTASTAPGCMSDATDPECMVMLPRLALPASNTAAGDQRLFTVP